MISTAKHLRAIFIFLMIAALGTQAVAQERPQSYKNTRKLLSKYDDQLTPGVLATLFKKGDERIADLVKALDDPDHKVSRNAQVIIRYLGNEAGMQQLFNWYRNSKIQVMVGAIPVPLTRWDYDFIRSNYLDTQTPTTARRGDYIYALLLDGSEQARQTLTELRRKFGDMPPESDFARAFEASDKGEFKNPMTGEKDLAKLVLKNAFFVSPSDKQYTSAKLIGFNGAKDKAIVEVYINRGIMAEEWYHVVISKYGEGWKFLSVTQVAVS